MTMAQTILPVTGPRAWRGDDMARRTDWIVQVGPEERAELEAAAETVRRRGIVLDDATRTDFDLPTLSGTLTAIKNELATGRGFVMLRGLPVEAYSVDELATVLWGLGTHLGIGVSQSALGDRIGHVVDLGATDRYYTAGGPIEFHMDPVDIVGLLCLKSALSGGESRIVSAMTVHNTVLEERPDLMDALYRGYHYSRRQQDPGGDRPITPDRVPVFKEGGLGLECYLLPLAIRQALTDGAPISDVEREALAFAAEVASRPALYLDMAFQEGDIQFLNNRVILHARTDYEEHPDPALRRHLLRLWLMMEDWPPRAMGMRTERETDRAGGGIPKREAAE